MKMNMGKMDRIMRVLVALVVLLLYFTGTISGNLALLGLIVSGVFIITGFIGFCPLYVPFGMRTDKEK